MRDMSKMSKEFTEVLHVKYSELDKLYEDVMEVLGIPIDENLSDSKIGVKITDLFWDLLTKKCKENVLKKYEGQS